MHTTVWPRATSTSQRCEPMKPAPPVTAIVSGIPQFEGLIFQTTDGGVTWVRQGVRGAPNTGETFPRLNRISIFDQNHVWIVGDGGAVLQYQP